MNGNIRAVSGIAKIAHSVSHRLLNEATAAPHACRLYMPSLPLANEFVTINRATGRPWKRNCHEQHHDMATNATWNLTINFPFTTAWGIIT